MNTLSYFTDHQGRQYILQYNASFPNVVRRVLEEIRAGSLLYGVKSVNPNTGHEVDITRQVKSLIHQRTKKFH